LYPAYSSYKTLTKRPAEETDLERWVMYWTVLASLLTLEHIFPLVYWIPFYSLLRFIFLLYLVLPQVQGSTYVYKMYLEPFMTEHEHEIDNILERSKSRLWQEGKNWVNFLWDKILSSLGMTQRDAQTAAALGGYQVPEGSGGIPVPSDAAVGAAQPPTLTSPLSGPAQMLGGLWRTYGPTLIASGAAFVQNQQANLARRSGPAVSEQSPRQGAVHGYDVGASSSASTRSQDAQMQSNLSRRRSGEGSASDPVVPFPVPSVSSTGQPVSSTLPSTPGTGSSNNSGDERDRRYDAISRDEVEGHEDSDRPTPQRSNSWFPWSPTNKGYERVKSE